MIRFKSAIYHGQYFIIPTIGFLNYKKYYGYKYSNLKKKKVESYSRLLDILFYYWAIYYYKKRENRVYFNIAVDKLNRVKNSIMSLKNFY